MSNEYMLSGKMNLPTQKSVNTFLGNQNESMLDKLLYTDFQRRLGGELTEKQEQRLLRTVRHYMGQVQDSMPAATLQEKNKEVIAAVVPDFLSYVQRSASAPPVREDDPTRLDVATRFSQLQTERNANKAKPPAPPEFRLTLENEGPTALSIFEQVKKSREEETARGEQLIAQKMRAETTFQENQAGASRFENAVIADRERMRQAANRESAAEMASRFVPPDPRRLFMKDVLDGQAMGQGTSLESLIGESGLATANMTLAKPEAVRVRPPLQQESIIPQDDVLAYKENEYNLFVYSADRDWLVNRNQNRYDFTVNFDPANNGSGFSYAPTASIKFKNITRIELVKTILPIEGLDIIQTREIVESTPVYDTSLNVNVLSFPYLNVYIPELDNNNYGTDYYFQQAFASLQYDANWVSDNQTASRGGFLAMIPKFLKCQKVYQPTPLATLRKLTIQIQRPDGKCVSTVPDTLDLSGLISSYDISDCPVGNADVTGTTYSDTSGGYIWIQTATWFSRFMVNQGDRIQLGAITFPSGYTGNDAAKTDLLEFLQRPGGHLVVAVAHSSVSAGTTYYKDGPNSVGYCNYIIIRSKMMDPTLGFTSPATFGLLNNSDNNTFLESWCGEPVKGRLINLSHQTTLVFRVITRDLDAATRLRPDNL